MKKSEQKRYKWKAAGGEFAKLDAGVIGSALEQLRERLGKLDPSDVVEEARDRKSPLHRVFPWDDARAAQIGREAIARNLIRSIHVTIVTPKREEIDVRAFVSVPHGEGDRSYNSISNALDSEEGRTYLLRKAWLEIMSCRRRYSELNELSEIWDAIDAADEKRKAG